MSQMRSTAAMLVIDLIQVLLPTFAVFSVNFRSTSANICGTTYYYFYYSSGTISSPNFPVQYPANVNCTYTIDNSYYSSVYIRFEAFSTESCCDRLTISCARGTMFSPRVIAGERYPSTLLIPSCNRVNLVFTSNSNGQSTGFSLVYAGAGTNGNFVQKPTNVFLQGDAAILPAFTFNCTSSSGFFPWWSNHRWSDGYNETVTNGFCNVSASYKSRFSSELLGYRSCNLIAIAQARSYHNGVFVCNYGTTESAGAVLVAIDPGFQFSKRYRYSVSTIKDLDPKITDELNYSCAPKFMHVSSTTRTLYFNVLGRPPSTAAQLRIVRTYWTNETGTALSRENSSYTSTIMVKTHSPLGVFPSYNCNIDVQFLSNISYIDNSSRAVMTFLVNAFQVSFGPVAEKMSLSGSKDGQVSYGGVLSCYAPAYPSATYQWTNEGTGEQVNEPSIVVTQSGQYTCTAWNFFNNRFYSDFKTIAVTLEEDKSDQRLFGILGMAIGVTCLVINMVFIVLVFRRCRKRNPDTAQNQDNSAVDALRLEPVGRQVNDYESQKEDNVDELYANDLQCDRISTCNSDTSDYEAIYEAP